MRILTIFVYKSFLLCNKFAWCQSIPQLYGTEPELRDVAGTIPCITKQLLADIKMKNNMFKIRIVSPERTEARGLTKQQILIGFEAILETNILNWAIIKTKKHYLNIQIMFFLNNTFTKYVILTCIDQLDLW